jgi:hypothetical protein
MTSSLDKLAELGTTAIARCSPSNPVADVSTFLGEIVKDGIPALIGGALRKWRNSTPKQIRKDLGGEYLNYEFGWKPFVSDLLKMGDAITRGDDIWRQYERDAGKVVRRRYEFPTEESITMLDMGYQHPYIGPDVNTLYEFRLPRDGKLLREHRVSKRQWFSGAFTYYLPVTDHGRGGAAEAVLKAKKLYGLTLTPETVYNLSPWSWALDWFSNTGDVVTNWTNWAIDGQVLWYGYIMEHVKSSYTYTWTGGTLFRDRSIRPSTITTVTETKVRRKATPYGFGITWDGFTPRQIAITTALGMSRGK